MTKRIRFTATILVFLIILSLTFTAGCILGNGITSSSDGGLEVIAQAWNTVFQEYVEKDSLDAGKLKEGAIKGLMDALNDPYSSYLSPNEYKLTTSDLAGKFEGIGAQVTAKDGKIMIIAPLDGSPAEKAGIKAGDVILKVNDTSIEGMSLDKVVMLIRGPSGTWVKLLILHEGKTEPVEIEVTRAEIKTESVRYKMINDIAYIRIAHFAENTDEEFSQKLPAVIQQGAKGIVLDLRNNPGGNLQTVINIASQLLKEGVVLNIVSNQGKQNALNVTPVEFTTDLPLVVLVNKFSASGSEVLSGALQDYGRATIAGTTTFGKGSVNILRRLQDGSGIYITTARWLTPKGNVIEGKGIKPDRTLELEGDDAVNWAVDFLKLKK